MAITCTLAVSPEGVNVGQPTEVTATVANSGAADVTVDLAELFVTPLGSTAGSVSASKGSLAPVVGRPGATPVAPAGGSVALKAKVILFDACPPGPGLASAETKYSVNARVWTTDAGVQTATDATAAVTLTQLDFANEYQRGLLDFGQSDRSCYAEE